MKPTPVDLRREFAARFKISRDPAANEPGQSKVDQAWLWTVPCAGGGRGVHIFSNGDRDGSAALGYFGTSAKVKNQLVALGVGRLKCEAKREFIFTFPLAAIDAVAAIVSPRRTRLLREADRKRLADANKAFRFTAAQTKKPTLESPISCPDVVEAAP